MQRKVKIKVRNWLAVEAHLRCGSGSHKGSKRGKDKVACRKFNVRKYLATEG